MSNYVAGHNAEKRAAEYLKSQGFKIRELNWKTRYCETDIVTEKDQIIYFVEVKYRRNAKYGSGLDYILPRKLQKMRFAAEMWINDQDWPGDCQLGVISIDADEITFIDCIA